MRKGTYYVIMVKLGKNKLWYTVQNGLLYGTDALEKKGYKVFYVFQWCFVIIT